MRRGHLLVAFVGAVSLSIDALVVVIHGVPFSPTQTWKDFQISTWISVGALFGAFLAVIAVMMRRRRLSMPRLPYSIAAIISYLYAAHMLDNFVGLSMWPTGERNEEIQKLGKTYGFGWTTGADGVLRIGVDQEELKPGVEPFRGGAV